MDIAVYLPDELGARAKQMKLPFSRMLRAAVEEEIRNRDRLRAAVALAYLDWRTGEWDV